MSNRPSRSAAARDRSAPPPNRRRTLAIAGAAAIVAVVVGIVVALAGGSDDATSTTDTRPAYGPVTIEGSALPALTSTSGDAAIGEAAPLIEGNAADGTPVTIGGPGQPTVIAFLAHWCPHCQRELPVVVDLMRGGDLDGVRMVAVLTGTSPDRPNFPPLAWLDREGWTGEILLDDDTSAAAQSYGLSSYPFLVFLDSDGKVVARTSGEVAAEDIVALANQAR